MCKKGERDSPRNNSGYGRLEWGTRPGTTVPRNKSSIAQLFAPKEDT